MHFVGSRRLGWRIRAWGEAKRESPRDKLHTLPGDARAGETWGQHIQAEEERGLCSDPGQELTE